MRVEEQQRPAAQRGEQAVADAADGDAGSFAAAPAGVVVSLGDLTAAGPQTIVFRVTID